MRLSTPELGNLSLDFLHTVRRSRGSVLDLVRTPEALAAWLFTHAGEPAAHLQEPLPPPDGRRLLDEGRRLRRDVGLLVATYARTGSLDDAATYGINRVLEGCPRTARLVTDGGRPAIVERTQARDFLAALGPVAEAAARLVATVEPGRIRQCSSDRCGAWFVDSSKGNRRRWCSMASCGNRQKASAHRSRSG